MTEKPPWESNTKPCRSWQHRWVVKEKEILPSFLEQIGKHRKLDSWGMDDPSKKSCIVTYVCYRCGSEKVERI